MGAVSLPVWRRTPPRNLMPDASFLLTPGCHRHYLLLVDAETLARELEARGLGNQYDAGEALRVDQSTVSRWLNGTRPIPAWVEVALKAIRAAKARART